MEERIKNAYRLLENKKLDGLLVSFSPNISYLTSTVSRDAFLLVARKKNIYFTDARYSEEAKRSLKQCEIKQINGSFYKTLLDSCLNLKIKQLGFEEKHLSFAGYNKLKTEFNDRITLQPTQGIIEELRKVKSADEFKKIKKATQIAIEAFRFIRKLILPGKTELQIAGELERFIRNKGASGAAFEIIVACGPNSSFPHHLTSNRKIKRDDLVLIDLGVDYLGYKSDLTRVFFLGKIKVLVKEVYQIIKEAQAEAIKRIKPGIATKIIDAAGRDFIAKKGYGKAFSHSLGHGVGLEVHEAPGISGKDANILKEGMVLTIEPGIYLPGRFGIRIEDMVRVTRKGVEYLSGSLNQ
ncbi:MAG: aminopeptidase P family protein [Candidatus Omnitrophica bacterium]|nr:aminopeptidase P family protein [Candidatus Omnitrophota bacterium]